MPLSILQVATGFPHWGGTELHLLNLSDQLRRRGHDVTVACRPGKWVEERAHQMGLPTVAIQVMKQNDWQDFGKLRAYLRAKNFDVMHVHWSTDVIVPGFAALFEHVPVRILSRHMPYPLKNRFGAFLYSRVLYNRLVPVSDSVRRTLIRSGVPDKRIEVIHHGTDVGAFAQTTEKASEVRRSLALPSDCVCIGIVGRIAPEKGHRYLLEAMHLLGDRYPLRCVVIGDGPEEDAMKALTNELGIADKVIFTGFRSDVNNVIGALDIVAVPSTWDEPCSAVVQQGMALYKPVLGTRTGGTPEMIVDGETGLLVPPKDAPALAEAIASLASDAFARRRMGEAGRERVERLFSLSVMTDKIEALYHREYQAARGADALQKVLVS
jgi:glycosyltransferase involved in cell wall biosynthesis